MNLWSVEHFLTIFFIKIRFSCSQNIGETLFYIEWVSLQCFDIRKIYLWGKKCSTDQRFTLKVITSKKFHTLRWQKLRTNVPLKRWRNYILHAAPLQLGTLKTFMIMRVALLKSASQILGMLCDYDVFLGYFSFRLQAL